MTCVGYDGTLSFAEFKLILPPLGVKLAEPRAFVFFSTGELLPTNEIAARDFDPRFQLHPVLMK